MKRLLRLIPRLICLGILIITAAGPPAWAATDDVNPNIERPFVIRSFPRDGEQNVPVNAAIKLTFSRQMDYLTFNEASVSLMDNVGGMISGVISYDSRSYTLTLTPAANLTRGEAFTLFIPAYLIRDVDGNAPAENISLVFRTAADNNTTPGLYDEQVNPRVGRHNPDVNAVDVPLDSTLVFDMTQPLAPESVRPDCLTLNDGARDLSCKIYYSDVDKQIIVVPERHLEPGKVYTAVLRNVFRSRLGHPMLSNYSFSFSTRSARDDTPPLITETSPIPGGINVSVNARIMTTFSEEMDPLSINEKTFLVLAGKTPIEGKVMYDPRTKKAMFAPLQRLRESTRYTCLVTVKVRDRSGNTMRTPVEWTFVTLTPPPVVLPAVTKTMPANGATDVEPTTKILIYFNKAMSEATANPFNLGLEDTRGPVPVTTAFIKGGNFVTLVPSRPLEHQTDYTVKIGPNLSDPEGHKLGREYRFSFRTMIQPDMDPPVVTQVEPREDGRNVAINSGLQIRFSEPLNPESITETTLLLRTESGTLVGGQIRLSEDRQQLFFQPRGNLDYITVYTAELAPTPRDGAGNKLLSARVWKFTTCNPPDRTPPRVLSTRPADKENRVAVSTAIKVFFSERLDTTGFTQRSLTVQDPAGETINGSLRWDDALKGLVLTPDRHLQHRTEYRCTVSRTLQDLAGNPLPESLLFRFTTEAPPDKVRPELVSCRPRPEEKDVSVTAPLQLTFTEPLNPVTVNPDSVRLETVEGKAIPCRIDYLEGQAMITLAPLEAMPWESELRLTVSRTVTDFADNALSATVIVPFRTVAEPDHQPPRLVRSIPENGSRGFAVDGTICLHFNEPLRDVEISEAHVTLISTSIGDNRNVPLRLAWVTDGNVLAVTPALRLEYEQEYRLTLTKFRDQAGNLNQSPATLVFRTEPPPDREPPRIVWSHPARENQEIDVSDSVAVRFSEPLLLDSINGTNVDLRDVDGTLPANVDWDGRSHTLYIRPDKGLIPGQEYFLLVSEGVSDRFGNRLANPARLHFRIRKPEDLQPPRVVKLQPQAGAVRVSTDETIAVIFSEAIQPESLNRHTILVESDGRLLPVRLIWEAERQTLRIRPGAPLPDGRECRITLTEGIMDLAGNTLEKPLSWAFLVGVGEAERRLTLLALSPHEGQEEVKSVAAVTAKFNAPLDPGSVNGYTFILKQDNRRVAGRVRLTDDGREAIFEPLVPLQSGQVFMVRLTEGIRSTLGRTLERPKVWRFKTAQKVEMSKR